MDNESFLLALLSFLLLFTASKGVSAVVRRLVITESQR
jgi:hypothetical protein